MRRNRVRWSRWLALLLVGALLIVNAIARMQAWAMTHYAPSGQRTPKPEELSFADKVGAVLFGVNVPRPNNSHTPGDLGIRYEVRQVGAGDGEIEAWYVPTTWRPAGMVLMFPAYAESKESLLPVANAFHNLGYELFMVDFRGVGGSSGQDTTLGVREAEDVALSADYARNNWPGRRIVLYGVSMGAAAILRAVAIEGVQPDALILESPFDRLLSTVANRFQALGLPSFPGAELLVFWGSVQNGFNGFDHNPADYARSVKCPSLFMIGERDPRVTIGQARSIYDALAGPKEIVAFPNAGHESLIASDRMQWQEKVTSFLTQIGPSPSGPSGCLTL